MKSKRTHLKNFCKYCAPHNSKIWFGIVRGNMDNMFCPKRLTHTNLIWGLEHSTGWEVPNVGISTLWTTTVLIHYCWYVLVLHTVVSEEKNQFLKKNQCQFPSLWACLWLTVYVTSAMEIMISIFWLNCTTANFWPSKSVLEVLCGIHSEIWVCWK